MPPNKSQQEGDGAVTSSCSHHPTATPKPKPRAATPGLWLLLNPHLQPGLAPGLPPLLWGWAWGSGGTGAAAAVVGSGPGLKAEWVGGQNWPGPKKFWAQPWSRGRDPGGGRGGNGENGGVEGEAASVPALALAPKQ